MTSNNFTSEYFEIKRINNSLYGSLIKFFKVISENNDEMFFHPHPLTPEQARKISEYNGMDLYYAVVKNKEIIGYGMLRGWDEGYIIPGLAIAIHPLYRNNGLGKCFISFLHMIARYRKADKIRLKVYKNNKVALNLYKKIGYIFSCEEGKQLVGFYNLG